MKKSISILMVFIMVLGMFTGCTSKETNGTDDKAKQVTLNFYSLGSPNVREFFEAVVIPKFEEDHPEATVNFVPIGAGLGDKDVLDKILAQKKAGKEEWDVDVWMIHPEWLPRTMEEDILAKYTSDVENSKLVTAPSAKMLAGMDVEGYVLPLYQSQVALAYDTRYVKEEDVPNSLDEIAQWTKANKGKFTYCDPSTGASGKSFVNAVIAAKTGYPEGEYKGKEVTDKWGPAWTYLNDIEKSLYGNGAYPKGNDSVLDLLNRGEVWMAPCWLDMVYYWQDQGRLSETVKVKLLDDALFGQPGSIVIPKKAANFELAKEFVNVAISPETQVSLVNKNYWYTGIDMKHVESQIKPEVKKIMSGISSEDLNTKTYQWPAGEYVVDSVKLWANEVAQK